ncbi:glycosyltransferase [Arcobacter arenosus]|uniref:glycosyltransferase n=1 Tax=Arcobacter arenosus TaxID=2576037 RepID=UPI003BAD5100
MKIYILFELKKGATGGGNQFLKAIKEYFKKVNSYTEIVGDADVILYNSYQFIPELIKIKKQYPNKVYIHRIDGPIRLYNTMDDRRDFVINDANELIADGTIFQSNWSRNKNFELGIKNNKFETMILNAPNPKIFNLSNKKKFSKNGKIKLIATSWSSNWKKGFEIYKWLDNNLDFDKYEMTFVGNSPIEFKNIKYKKPMNSEDLANELKQNDIFFTASQKDPCSNSLIEALHCGLPAIGFNDGGHPEIISSAGKVFNEKEEILSILEEIVKNYEQYQQNIELPSLDEVGKKYFEFLEAIYNQQQNKQYKSKSFNLVNQLNLNYTLFFWKISEKFNSFKNRLYK